MILVYCLELANWEWDLIIEAVDIILLMDSSFNLVEGFYNHEVNNKCHVHT